MVRGCSVVGMGGLKAREKCETKEEKKGEREEGLRGRSDKRGAAISRRKDRTTERQSDRQARIPGGQFNSSIEVSIDFSKEFSIEFC